MTNGSATMPASPGQPCQLRFEQPPNLLVGEAARTEPLYRGRDDRLAGAKRVGRLLRPRIPRDERAGAMTQLDDAFVLELAIGLRHRVRIDHELLRQRPDPGQLLARAERAGLDAMLHLLHQLQVDGNAQRWIRSKQHRNQQRSSASNRQETVSRIRLRFAASHCLLAPLRGVQTSPKAKRLRPSEKLGAYVMILALGDLWAADSNRDTRHVGVLRR